LAGQGMALNQSLPVADHRLWSPRRDFHGTILKQPGFLCVLIVRMERDFHVVLLINLMDKPGIFKDFAVIGWVKVPFYSL
jgi:hypothetical protein